MLGLGSRMRSHMRLPDIAHVWKSAFIMTGWCLTWISWPLMGLASKGGLWVNTNESDT